MIVRALLCFLVGAFACVQSAPAHEPYLQISANPDGTFTAETGFSDGSDVAGLKLSIRSRTTSETLSEHVLPTGGKLALPIPAVPYRVTFDGGPGHKVSKLGPERLIQASPPAETFAPPATIVSGRASVGVAPSRSATTAPAEAAPTVPVATEGRAATLPFSQSVVAVALVFLLAILSFGLGYVAANRGKPSR